MVQSRLELSDPAVVTGYDKNEPPPTCRIEGDVRNKQNTIAGIGRLGVVAFHATLLLQ